MNLSSRALLVIYGAIGLVGHIVNAAPGEHPSFVTESSSSFNEPDKKLGVNHKRFVVSMKDGTASRFHAMRGAKVGQRFADGKLAVVEFDKDTDREKFLAQANSARLIVEEDPPIYPYVAQIDYNVSRSLQEQIPWGINDVFTRADGTVDIPGPDYYPSETRHICIIDSGYQDSHPDLVTTASNADPSQGDSYKEDGCQHGTHVAGTIVATGNNEGVIGVFPGASAFIVKVFGYGDSTSCGWSYSSSLVSAAQHCRDRGADIISMSLGGSGSSNFLKDVFQTLNDINGILSIAAAGNAGNGAFSYPASYDSIMSVGATDANKNIASFSQHNSQVDISGPGVAVISTVGENGYSYYSGTSMATPHVSGVALLLWNKYPTCTNNDIREALEGSALDRGETGKDVYFGHGIVRYWNAVDFLKSKPCGAVESPPTPPPVNAPTSPPNHTTLPSVLPTLAPISSKTPSKSPSIFPTIEPTPPKHPSKSPSIFPTFAPIQLTIPTTSTSISPTLAPILPTTPLPNSPPTGNPSKCGSNDAELIIYIGTDKYPAETNWKVKNVCTETTLLEKNQRYSKNVEYSHEYCIPNDQEYSFTISDSYGDGICCDYGDGKYSVTYDGIAVKKGGQFDASESTNFGSCSPTIAPTVSPTSNSTTNSVINWDEVFFNDFEQPDKFGDFTKGGYMASWHGKGVHSFSGKGALFIRHGLGKNSAFISRPFDVSDYTEVKVDFMFKAVGTEIGDGFALEYSIDGGIKYFTEKIWKRGTEFNNGEYYAVIENIAVDPSFNMMRIRFIALGNQKNDKIFIDDVSVLGALDSEVGGGEDEDVM